MAVGRVELMPSELVWLVDTLKASGVPHERRRAVREIERARDRAVEMERAERAHSRKLRRMYPTDAATACIDCGAAQRDVAGALLHTPGCPAVVAHG
jgi:hypothetical protein